MKEKNTYIRKIRLFEPPNSYEDIKLIGKGDSANKLKNYYCVSNILYKSLLENLLEETGAEILNY